LFMYGYCPSNGVVWVDYINATGSAIDQQPHTLRAIQFAIQ
jgi:hypothetical protein